MYKKKFSQLRILYGLTTRQLLGGMHVFINPVASHTDWNLLQENPSPPSCRLPSGSSNQSFTPPPLPSLIPKFWSSTQKISRLARRGITLFLFPTVETTMWCNFSLSTKRESREWSWRGSVQGRRDGSWLTATYGDLWIILREWWLLL